MKQLFLIAVFSLLATGSAAHAQTTAASDPILSAMKAELDRSAQKLILPGMEKAYFIEYRLEDIAQFEATANFGALVSTNKSQQKVIRVSVRMGNYQQDSSSPRGDGVVQLAPENGDPVALRQSIWFATDEAYKNALRSYAAKQAALKRFQTPPTADDFSAAKPMQKLDPLVQLTIDEDAWTKRIVAASGLYATDAKVKAFAPEIQYSSASVRGIAVNRYTVNTEGTRMRTAYTVYAASVSVAAQAADGMRLTRDNGTTAAVPSELEPDAKFRERVVENIESLRALRQAPVVGEDYHGPVLFSGDAAADIMNRLFIPNIEADKPDAGTTARTQGAYTSSYRARVLPEFLSATDDPTMATFHGKHLVGSYTIDDEGVPAEKVDVAVNGILQKYLIDRAPVKDFPASNGHGRAGLGQPAQSRSAVMTLHSSKPVPRAELERRLAAMAKDQKRDYVYSAETLGGDLVPRVLYRIYPDGHRELVRGAVFDELDQRSLRSEVMAAGDDPYLSMTITPVPQTTIAPSLLFGDIAVKRATQEQEKVPYYPPPSPPPGQ